ncbi:hypothetical protein IPM65_05520 [Candidatus Roizmanbacteria bacterium]|nr:MAG: hypothetical protein IPM65_05520 [Candidatus Roizmanbacteria bacterium]
MKRRLNLFTQRSRSRQIVSYYGLIRKISLIVSGVGFIILIAVGFTYYYLLQEKQTVDSDSASYHRYILLNESFSKQIQQFVFKYNALQSYLKEDAHSYDYYEKTIGIFEKTAAAEALETFSVNNSREAEITINFSDYNDALSFIEELETPLFSDSFERIAIAGFSVVQENQEGYQLTLDGVFISPDADTTRSD